MGGRIKGVAAARLTSPQRSPPRLWRSQAGGGTPPDPLGCAPSCALRHTGTLRPLSPSRRGFGARVRPVAGVGNAQRCPRSTPSPFPSPLDSVFQRLAVQSAAGGSGGRAPRVGRRWATRPRRWAVRVQPQAVPAVHGLGEVIHGRPGHRAQRSRLLARRRRSARRFIEEPRRSFRGGNGGQPITSSDGSTHHQL